MNIPLGSYIVAGGVSFQNKLAVGNEGKYASSGARNVRRKFRETILIGCFHGARKQNRVKERKAAICRGGNELVECGKHNVPLWKLGMRLMSKSLLERCKVMNVLILLSDSG
jgi:hypothetical protein